MIQLSKTIGKKQNTKLEIIPFFQTYPYDPLHHWLCMGKNHTVVGKLDHMQQFRLMTEGLRK